MNLIDIPPKKITTKDELDLTEIWNALWAGKSLILITVIMFSSCAALYALKLPNIYKASTLLSPAGEHAGGMSNLSSQFGGIASLAGIDLSSGGIDKTGLALEVIKSRKFITNFIEKHELLVPLMGVNRWNSKTNTLEFDSDVYNEHSGEWIDLDGKDEPSTWESFQAFRKLLLVSKDAESGMIEISIEHFSPYTAEQWLLWLVEDINKTMRQQDKNDARNRIDFLKNKLKEIQIADMQTVFYQLIEEQTKTIMLAEVTDEYVLKTIDPANVPDEKNRPKRAIIVILGAILGALLGVLFVFLRYLGVK